MDRLIYTALTGLQRAQEAQGVTANNLANLQTPGFRREMAALSGGWLVGQGAAGTARVQSGGEAPADVQSQGRVEATARPLDIAIDGNAWLTVGDAAGNPALTRRGDLRVDSGGRLLTGDGLPVMGEDGPVQLPSDFSSLRIANDGALEILPVGEAVWAPVGRLLLQSAPAASLERGEDGLFRSPQAQPDPGATIQTGALERSNMDAASALVELVEQSRRFEMQTKLLSAAREMDEGAAALMRVQ
ncbi:flagellar basal body rod protein FlgF [Sandaracinobacter sp. RS1-74]|uniref:flagellar basal body rod protein FlgF n=1 Tax=Sandaracinobacteroides sayramensis TaxID=2913411 RepID=UPI001EDA2418|nr:flagellar basal body rod protein FlgF [Sandaracinobacteroides sayramensis]MCG2840079.1 flagellar basal body rod protein FlgF [Sandaracinobacteroides sayramensis]